MDCFTGKRFELPQDICTRLVWRRNLERERNVSLLTGRQRLGSINLVPRSHLARKQTLPYLLPSLAIECPVGKDTSNTLHSVSSGYPPANKELCYYLFFQLSFWCWIFRLILLVMISSKPDCGTFLCRVHDKCSP